MDWQYVQRQGAALCGSRVLTKDRLIVGIPFDISLSIAGGIGAYAPRTVQLRDPERNGWITLWSAEDGEPLPEEFLLSHDPPDLFANCLGRVELADGRSILQWSWEFGYYWDVVSGPCPCYPRGSFDVEMLGDTILVPDDLFLTLSRLTALSGEMAPAVWENGCESTYLPSDSYFGHSVRVGPFLTQPLTFRAEQHYTESMLRQLCDIGISTAGLHDWVFDIDLTKIGVRQLSVVTPLTPACQQ